MSPILVRPVREQLEHDRVVRLLQAKYKRKFEVAVNSGNEQTTPVSAGPLPWYPDLVLQSADRARRVLGTVEVETAESVNNLEAMSQWATFSRLRAPFHLYIPASSVDVAKRLCVDLRISVSEVWAYNALGGQIRFVLVQRSSDGKRRTAAPPRAAAPAKAKAKAKRPAAASRTRSSRVAAVKTTQARAARTRKASSGSSKKPKPK